MGRDLGQITKPKRWEAASARYRGHIAWRHRLKSRRGESDAQDQLVRHCRRSLILCWRRRMGRFDPSVECCRPIDVRVDTLQMMMNGKDLRTEQFQDFTFVFD